MKKETVNFTVGEGLGLRIMEIAQEHVKYTLNPQKGLDTILKSLIGCPRDIALKILSGEMVLPVDVETQQIVCCDREEIHNIFPELNPAQWATDEIKKINQYIAKPKGANYNYDLFDWIYEVKERYEHKSTISFDISKSALIKYALNEDESEIIRDLKDSDEYFDFVYPFIVLHKFIAKSFKTVQVIEILKKWYPDYFKNVQINISELISLKGHFDNVIRNINTVVIKKTLTELDNELQDFGSLDSYIKHVHENDAILSKGIEPVNILDNYDAGWLAPNGDFYGLNGEIANNLHIQIADALFEKGIIPNDIEKNMADSWLEKNGWVKIHNNWILYDGYNLYKYGGKNMPLTDIQIKKIYEYGALCCDGILKVGYKQELITAPRFQMIEPLMYARLFEF
jgi:hypothetical protein